MSKHHPTTRRGFIAAAGFGGVSLYGLWAAYGAAPTPLALLGLGGSHDADGPAHGHGNAVAAPGGHGNAAPAPGGHAGHGAGADSSVADDFRRRASEFVERYRTADGSVYPHHVVAAARSQSHEAHDSDEAIDVYLLAEKWFYEPAVLRLDAGETYRFRMMATDVSHGASIQFGRGGRMIRLRPNTLVELAATFDQPGTYLVYCTVYCGVMHDYMKARIEVV